VTKEEFVQQWILNLENKSLIATEGTDEYQTPNKNFVRHAPEIRKRNLQEQIDLAGKIYDHIQGKIFWPNGQPDLSKVTTK
jgi:hypothetical protein